MFFLEQFQGQLGATILFSKVTQTRVVRKEVMFFQKSGDILSTLWPLPETWRGHSCSSGCCLHCSSWSIPFSLNLVTLGAWKIFTLYSRVLCQIFSVLKNIETLIHHFFPSDKIQFSSWGCKICYKSVKTLAQHKEIVLNQEFMLKEYKWVVRRAWETLLLLLWEFGNIVWL